MRSSTRFAVLMVLALGMLSFSAIPALAKGAPGEDPAVRTVVLFGPNMRVPAVFQGQAALDFARDSGMLDAANVWSTVATTVPRSVLLSPASAGAAKSSLRTRTVMTKEPASA